MRFTSSNGRAPLPAIYGGVSLGAVLLLSMPAAAQKAPSAPKVIVIDTTPAPKEEGGTTPAPPATPRSPEEQRADDNAYLAGATDLDQTFRIGDEARKVERDVSLRSGRCYSISVAWAGQYRATLTYTLGRSGDSRAVNDAVTGDSGVTQPREGVVQVCADRSGPLRLSILAEEGGAKADARREYVVVVGSRAESAPQRDARHRRASAQRAAPPVRDAEPPR